MSDRFDSTVDDHLRLLRRRLPPRGPRRERQARLDHALRCDGPANNGHTCLKGRFAHQFSRSRDRLTTPLIRERRRAAGRHLGGGDRHGSPASSGGSRSEHGPDAIAGLASSRATNEDCYAMQRLMRAAIGTNNIDNCSRVCHSPTSFALRKSFGLSGATGSFDDIDAADAAIIIGANPTEAHPVVGARIKQATLRGLKLVTIDPRRIELADYGVLHLAPRPGTNAAVMLGLAHVAASLTASSTATSSTSAPTGYEEYEALLAQYAPGRGRRRSPASRPPTSRRRRTSTPRPPTRRSCGASGSPSTSTARRSCG